ncbi:MAG: hypothetical protein IJM51_01630 [Clostridia bacterium]|nr:hypothetical protein [Clostridia bacterium]
MPDNNNESSEFSGLLPLLRFNLRETSGDCACGCAAFTENDLLALLEKHGGNVNAASYEGLLIKARCDSVTLPDGLALPDGRSYWLHLARLYRPVVSRNIPRAEEVE